MPKYNVVNTDKLLATQGGGHIHSYTHDRDMENGMAVIDAGAVQGEREIRKCALPDGSTRIALVANPTTIDCVCLPSEFSDDQFVNLAGKPFRAYDLHYGDIFSVANYGMDVIDTAGGMPVAGNFVHVVPGSERFTEVAAMPIGEAFVGEITEVGGFPMQYGIGFSTVPKSTPFKWVTIRVIRNETI